MIAAFFGHSDVCGSEELNRRLDDSIAWHIDELHVTEFIVGGMGNFDLQAEEAVMRAKKRHPGIKLSLIIPYETAKLKTQKDYYSNRYDSIIYPHELHGTYPKGAITKRNQWMVDQADYIICFVDRKHGGAWTAIRYANKKGKKILNLAGQNL